MAHLTEHPRAARRGAGLRRPHREPRRRPRSWPRRRRRCRPRRTPCCSWWRSSGRGTHARQARCASPPTRRTRPPSNTCSRTWFPPRPSPGRTGSGQDTTRGSGGSSEPGTSSAVHGAPASPPEHAAAERPSIRRHERRWSVRAAFGSTQGTRALRARVLRDSRQAASSVLPYIQFGSVSSLRVQEVNTMAVDIKKVSRTILEDVYGKGRLEYLDQVCDPSFKAHDPLSGEADLAGVKREVETYRSAFPDMEPTVLGLCAEADVVCMRWRVTGTHQKRFLGVEPTGKKITIEGMSFDRFRNGKLIEVFSQWDTLGLLQALGVVPRIDLAAPKGAAERRPHA